MQAVLSVKNWACGKAAQLPQKGEVQGGSKLYVSACVWHPIFFVFFMDLLSFLNHLEKQKED